MAQTCARRTEWTRAAASSASACPGRTLPTSPRVGSSVACFGSTLTRELCLARTGLAPAAPTAGGGRRAAVPATGQRPSRTALGARMARMGPRVVSEAETGSAGRRMRPRGPRGAGARPVGSGPRPPSPPPRGRDGRPRGLLIGLGARLHLPGVVADAVLVVAPGHGRPPEAEHPAGRANAGHDGLPGRAEVRSTSRGTMIPCRPCAGAERPRGRSDRWGCVVSTGPRSPGTRAEDAALASLTRRQTEVTANKQPALAYAA